ncbi:hypothetical protein HK104_000234 [Borealophlyctis nickersoniae]|nr:hypothetical protein HK104_000234 [Borealophlyctis nickersoniae]
MEDEQALKRKRNTEAARRSRERKAQHVADLEAQVRRLEGDKTELLFRLAVMEKERMAWVARERELVERNEGLSAQLKEAHEALVTRAGGEAGKGVRVIYVKKGDGKEEVNP